MSALINNRKNVHIAWLCWFKMLLPILCLGWPCCVCCSNLSCHKQLCIPKIIALTTCNMLCCASSISVSICANVRKKKIPFSSLVLQEKINKNNTKTKTTHTHPTHPPHTHTNNNKKKQNENIYFLNIGKQSRMKDISCGCWQTTQDQSGRWTYSAG